MARQKIPEPVEIVASTEVHRSRTQTALTKPSRPTHRHVDEIVADTEDAAREQAMGFVNFLRENAIVGLAVGFIVGTQAQGVVKQLVASFIDPVIILLFGGARLAERKVTLVLNGNTAEFAWGAMVYALINLLFVLVAIYVLIKIFKLDKLDKKKS